MGNPRQVECPIENFIHSLKEYKNMIDMDTSDENKLFKIQEINRKITELSKELDSILECYKKNDFSITDEEKSFYVQRFILLNLMSSFM